MGQTALITGASSGIGSACSEALAERGFRVCLLARREPMLTALCEKINARHRGQIAMHVAGDVTDPDVRQAAVDRVVDQWQQLDVLVNCAGRALAGAVEEVDLDDLRRQFEVNTFSALGMMQLCGRVMRGRGSGRIINMSSISGRVAFPVLGAYAASKFAMEALSDAARVEYRPWGIKVCLVEPGAIATDIWQNSCDDLAGAQGDWASSPFVEFYQAELKHAEEMIKGNAPGPEVVARAVVRAATARRPKARYFVTMDSKVLNLLAHWPARLRDWAISRLYGISRKYPPATSTGEAKSPDKPPQ